MYGMQYETMRVVILVKAAPVLTSQLEETMCVAGARIDHGSEWVRLHPVPFRDLDDDERFRKYQVVQVEATRSATDRRPESWRPIQGTIKIGDELTTADGWASRRGVVSDLEETRMCDLVAENRSGSGPGVRSLAVVRPRQAPKLLITERDESQLREWRRRARASAERPSLFDDPEHPKPELEVIPWRFRYDYKCEAPGCDGHKQTIVDWEIVALWRRVRHRADWKELLQQRFEHDLWYRRDAALFVGNMAQRPWNFLVLGVFWPPAGSVQGAFSV
jgi:hypothetical protein